MSAQHHTCHNSQYRLIGSSTFKIDDDSSEQYSTSLSKQRPFSPAPTRPPRTIASRGITPLFPGTFRTNSPSALEHRAFCNRQRRSCTLWRFGVSQLMTASVRMIEFSRGRCARHSGSHRAPGSCTAPRPNRTGELVNSNRFLATHE